MNRSHDSTLSKRFTTEDSILHYEIERRRALASKAVPDLKTEIHVGGFYHHRSKPSEFWARVESFDAKWVRTIRWNGKAQNYPAKVFGRGFVRVEI